MGLRLAKSLSLSLSLSLPESSPSSFLAPEANHEIVAVEDPMASDNKIFCANQ